MPKSPSTGKEWYDAMDLATGKYCVIGKYRFMKLFFFFSWCELDTPRLGYQQNYV